MGMSGGLGFSVFCVEIDPSVLLVMRYNHGSLIAVKQASMFLNKSKAPCTHPHPRSSTRAAPESGIAAA